MNHRFPTFAAGALGALTLLGTGCNETTRDDVTSAHRTVQQEQQRLDDMKREDAAAIAEERREARVARTTNKPIVGDDINEGPAEERREVSQAERDAIERESKQQARLAEARAKLEKTKVDLTAQVDRDKFLAEARLHIDAANRAVEKLQAKRNAADDAGKGVIDEQIKEIQHRQDLLKTELDRVKAAEVPRWSDHQDDVNKALQELDATVRKIT